MMIRIQRILIVALLCFTLQGCIVTSMLFDPGVRSAFIIPKEVTPIASLKSDPESFFGEHIAISGRVTEVSTDFFVIEDFVSVKLYGAPWSRNLSVGDNVSVRGKLVSRAFGTKRPQLLNTFEFPPNPGPQAISGANTTAMASPIPH